MIINKVERKGIILLELKGSLDAKGTKLLGQYISPLRHQYPSFALDLSNVSYMDVNSTNFMLKFYASVVRNKGKLYLIGPNSHIQHILSSSNVDKVIPVSTRTELFRIYPEKDDALEYRVFYNEKIDDINLDFHIRKIPIKYLIHLFDDLPVLTIYLEEDCSGFNRGRKLNKADCEKIKSLGYDNIWISREVKEPPDNSYEEKIRYAGERLYDALKDLFIPINEADYERKIGNLKYLSGTDLFNPVLTPMQMGGAQAIYMRLFGSDLNKLDKLSTIIKDFIDERIPKIGIFNNRSLGTIHIPKPENGNFPKESSEFLFNLIQHAISTTLTFIVASHNVHTERARLGATRSMLRLEKGEKKIDYTKRFLFEYDYISSAALGAVLHDVGYLHNASIGILEKELKLLAEDGKLPEHGPRGLSEEDTQLIRRHVNVGYNIYSAFEENEYASPIANNIIKYHHCLLDGSGYPGRKEAIEDGELTYKTPMHELVRLFVIVNFFDNLIYRKTYRLPVRRSSAAQYLLANRVYPVDPTTGNIDTAGMFELDTTKQQPLKFDGYLVDAFLRSINLYKLNERIIVRNNQNNKILHGLIADYNELPHRPVVKIIHQAREGYIDLSLPKFKDWSVDELYPCVAIE